MSVIKEIKAGKLSVKAYETRNEMGRAAAFEAANVIIRIIAQKGECNIIFAAAPSQNEFLSSLASDTTIDFSKINAFHMDEYIGLSADAVQGFGNFLRDRLFEKVNFKSVNYIDGNADPEAECQRYGAMLETHIPDVVCMGIGENAHIAFNDPHVADFNDSVLVKVVDLDQACRIQQVNDGCFESIEQVPTHALTLTIPALVSAEHIFCMVPAKTKAEAVFHTINNEISSQYPATILKNHNNAIMYIDKDSGSKVPA